jgi:hypothetical protein
MESGVILAGEYEITLARRQEVVKFRMYGVPVTLRRLKFLFLGVFCLTGMVGCLLDAVVLGSKPFANVIAWIVFTGIMADVYLSNRDFRQSTDRRSAAAVDFL